MKIKPNDVFIVVDTQVDFVSGSMAIPGGSKIIAPINAAAEKFDHIVVVTDWHPADHISFASVHGKSHGDSVESSYGTQFVFNDHCAQGTPGAELDPGLELTRAELIFRKGTRRDVDSFSAFYENDGMATGLSAYLKARGYTRVFCAGLARYGCVMQTALGAAKDGFETYMLHDASAGDRNIEEGNRKLADAGVTWLDSTDLTA